MDNKVVDSIMGLYNFKTQTHALMKSTRVSKNEAISMLIRFMQPRINHYSSDEILELINKQDNVFLYKITYSRKDAEREYFNERNRSDKIRAKLEPLYKGAYQPFYKKDDRSKVDFVIKNAYRIFTRNTAEFVIHLLTRGESYTKEVYQLQDKPFLDKIKKITRQYIPNHREDINNLIDSQYIHDNKRDEVIDNLIQAHNEDNVDVKVQEIFDANKNICEELIGECDTPYIHHQGIFLKHYANSPSDDKRAFARYLMKIEN